VGRPKRSRISSLHKLPYVPFVVEEITETTTTTTADDFLSYIRIPDSGKACPDNLVFYITQNLCGANSEEQLNNPTLPSGQIGLDINGQATGDYNGQSVSLNLNGSVLAVGAIYAGTNSEGQVRVYELSGSSWVQRGGDINGTSSGGALGNSVSLSDDGSVVAMGAPYAYGSGVESGHTKIYAWSGSVWVQRGDNINGSELNANSGHSVSLNNNGNIVAIGAPGAENVKIYEWSGSEWIQKGSDIDGFEVFELFGHSVSLSDDGSVVAIGAPNYSGNEFSKGRTTVFEWSGSSWIQRGNDIVGEAAGDASGYYAGSVSLNNNGNIVAIGAYRNDGNGTDSGHVRVYEWSGSAWIQKGGDIDGEAAGDNSGISVSLDYFGDLLAIGAGNNDGNGASSGHVRIYEWSGSAWVQKGSDIDGEAAGDISGISVSLSRIGSRVAIGAPANDGNGTSSGHVRVYQLSTTEVQL